MSDDQEIQTMETTTSSAAPKSKKAKGKKPAAKKATSKKPAAKKSKGKGAKSTEKKASPANGETPREGSKMGKLFVRLSAKGGATLPELVKASGYDEQNVRTAIGVIRAGRVKGGAREVVLDRETGKYAIT